MLNFNFRLFVYYSFLILSIFASDNINAESNTSDSEVTADAQEHTITKDSIEEENLDYDDIVPFPEEAEKEVETEESFFSFFDSTHEFMSGSVEAMATNIDKFFVDDEEFYESSGSYLRLRQNMIFNESGQSRSLSEIRFKLRLPKTQKNFKLFFESSSPDEPYDVTTKNENTPQTLGEEGDYVLGIQAESGEGFGWKYKPTLGAKINSSIDTIVKFKFSREDKLQRWTISWDETLYWYDSIGWGFDSSLQLNRKIDEKNLFRSSTYAGWKNETDQFDLSQVFAIFHTFNNKRAISFYTGVYGVSEPTITTTQYLIGSIYRKNIHKDYLFFEVEPQIRYQRINNFDAEHSIVFRLEFVFKK
ncbi:MAG: hypothetical protein OQK75_12545 [Gammaproteobacteria bacterium]|nr:hypothetical protein [Gammaproteobacteria bacterium]MCW8988487.1 hypothetical protein [Gammaproteobacteria bacterium]MCW9031779.1 hypothetical protein [Gammaproteobacteria bacterium]